VVYLSDIGTPVAIVGTFISREALDGQSPSSSKLLVNENPAPELMAVTYYSSGCRID